MSAPCPQRVLDSSSIPSRFDEKPAMAASVCSAPGNGADALGEEILLEEFYKIAERLGAEHDHVLEFVIHRRPPASQIAPKPMAWLTNVNNRHAPHGIFAVSKTMNSLFRHLEADKGNQFINIDRALSDIIPEKANAYHAVAVMRALAPFREQLPTWPIVEAAMRQAFSKRFANSEELNIDVLMRGLSDNKETPVPKKFL